MVYDSPVKGKNKENLRSGELARLAGISADTLRFYERKGLLSPPHRSANGYRIYPLETLHRVRIIRSALAVGFTVKELGGIFKMRNRGDAPCEEVLRIAQSKFLQLESRILELNQAKCELQKCIVDWKEALARTQKGERAGLLDKLDQSDRPRRSSPMVPPGLKKGKGE
jgi:DNA-binding transcriptional MerR regulator